MTEAVKPIVRGLYDLQRLRIQMGNRIVANYKARMGQAPGTKEDELDDDAQKILANIRENYKLLAEGMTKLTPRYFRGGNEVISSFTELCLVSQYISLLDHEKQYFKQLEHILKDYPIWELFLQDVRGCGPAMAAVIISEVDITKCSTVSSLWKYAGLDVAQDGRGRSKRSDHLVDVEYVASDGTVQTKRSITYNPFLKTKLMGVLAGSFIKTGDNPYNTIYRDYKHRLENHPVYKDHSKGHRHNMALRYAVKMFLKDLYVEWRTLEKLPVRPSYQEEKLGHRHAA